jgi:hypothetical protein
LTGNRPLLGYDHHPGEFDVDPLVFPTTMEEILQRCAILAPRPQGKLRDLGKLPVVVRKFALAPVVHHQQQIGPVLRRGQVAGVAEIVADIKGHPGTVHLARFI